MRGLALGVLVVAAVASASGQARAQGAGAQPARVSVDWAGVSDADVERCGLSRLRAGTIERLVADGHAVVESVGGSGVHATVASVPDGLRVQVASDATAREEVLHAGTPCDATFVLEAISRIAELVSEVVRATPVATVAVPAPVDSHGTQDSVSEASPAVYAGPSGMRFQGDVGVRLNVAPDYQWSFGLALGARARSGWELGVRLEGAMHPGRVLVFEPFLGVTVAYLPWRAVLGPYVELGPLLHLARSDGRSITELDGSLGAGGQLELGEFVVHLLAYARLRSLEHRVGSDRAFETGHFGVVLRIGAQIVWARDEVRSPETGE